MISLRTLVLATFSSIACACHAQLSFDVSDPAFHVSVPSFPPLTLGDHPMRSQQPHLQLYSSKDGYGVSVLTPTADQGMKPADCASSTVRNLPNRPGVPSQDRIYKARIDANTFVAVYASPMPGFLHLHAHLLSAAGGTHCVEVHLSKVATSKDDVEPWFKGFADARIEPR